MKKILAGIISSLAVVALCICLTACSTTFTGTWKLSKVTVSAGGMEQTMEAGKEYNGSKISADAIIIEIKEDNTYEVKGELASMIGGAETGTWEEKDGKYYLDELEVSLNGTTLVMEYSESGLSVKMELKK
ncbi:MAG: hypothetical protein HDQ88_02045 [Clostridia bacterium]|nr:hypothetical protein [Clostridia bacterium]